MDNIFTFDPITFPFKVVLSLHS